MSTLEILFFSYFHSDYYLILSFPFSFENYACIAYFLKNRVTPTLRPRNSCLFMLSRGCHTWSFRGLFQKNSRCSYARLNCFPPADLPKFRIFIIPMAARGRTLYARIMTTYWSDNAFCWSILIIESVPLQSNPLCSLSNITTMYETATSLV